LHVHVASGDSGQIQRASVFAAIPKKRGACRSPGQQFDASTSVTGSAFANGRPSIMRCEELVARGSQMTKIVEEQHPRDGALFREQGT